MPARFQHTPAPRVSPQIRRVSTYRQSACHVAEKKKKKKKEKKFW
jgi:hypothetical protein